MDNQLTIPKEILKEFIRKLILAVNDNGEKKYNNEEIVQIVKDFENAFKENNIKFVNQN